jgi:hypothetical protein
LFFAAFSAVLLCTWGFFVSLGPRAGGLLPTKSDRDAWLSSQSPTIIRLQNTAAIVGTLTSFATVFIFYLGESKRFGVFIFATLLALFLSHYVTNWATRTILAQKHLRLRTLESDQAGAAVARMFWSDAREDRHIALIVQIISLLSVLGIVWFEFSLLTKYLSWITRQPPLDSLVFMFCLSFGVVWFTLRYGVRGFVFADLIQVPILGMCFIVLCASAIAVWIESSAAEVAYPDSIIGLLQPSPQRDATDYSLILLFVLHVTAVNLFLPLVSETHWLRVWAFKEMEIATQRSGLAATTLLAIPLIVAGVCTYYFLKGQSGDAAIFGLVAAITQLHPVFGFIFWVAAVAALFSTADTHIYAALVLSRFNSKTGQMVQPHRSPFLFALLSSFLFVSMYALVQEVESRYGKVIFNKIVFIVVPSALILLPPILDLARANKPSIGKLYLAAIGYWTASVIGLFAESRFLVANLIAALIPVSLSFLPGRKDHQP